MTYLPWLTRTKLLVFSVAYWALVVTIASLSFSPDTEDGLKVFGAYWASGDASLHGLNPYAIYPLTWCARFNIAEVNLNPPTMLPLFELIARFEPVTVARIWTIVSGLLFVGANAMLLADRGNACQRRQIIWMFLVPAFSNTLHIGQVYIFLFALGVGAWLCLQRGHHLAAGVLIGLLVAAKPNFAVWPLFLLLVGVWRPAVFAGVTVVTAVGLSIGIYGIDVYSQWLAAIATDTHVARFLTEVSIHGYMTRLGFPTFGTVVSAIFLLWSAVWVRHRRCAMLDASRVGLVVAILASPLAWVDYTLFLIPALIQRSWNWTSTIAAGLLMVPLVIPHFMMGGPQWMIVSGGSIYFAALCLIFTAVTIETQEATASQYLAYSGNFKSP